MTREIRQAGRHDAVQSGILREPILERQDDIAIEQQAFAFAALGDVGQLMRRNAQLLHQNLTVARCLVEHIDVVGVLENVLDLLTGKQVFDVLRDARWNAAPLAEPLPDFHGVCRRLLLLEQQVELVHVVPGGFALGAVGGDAAPHLILHDEHPQLLELLAQLLDVVADQPIVHVHVGAMVEHVLGTRHINFQRCRQRLRFLFFLLSQGVVQILQNRDIFRPWVVQVGLVDDVNRAVDDGLFDRLQAIAPADDQLAQ